MLNSQVHIFSCSRKNSSFRLIYKRATIILTPFQKRGVVVQKG